MQGAKQVLSKQVSQHTKSSILKLCITSVMPNHTDLIEVVCELVLSAFKEIKQMPNQTCFMQLPDILEDLFRNEALACYKGIS